MGSQTDRREAALERRNALIAAIAADPSSYVVAVEGRDDTRHDIVLHVSRTMAAARAYCLRQPEREYFAEARLHLVPHRLDAPDDDVDTGTISVAAYGVRPGETTIEDLIGTDDE